MYKNNKKEGLKTWWDGGKAPKWSSSKDTLVLSVPAADKVWGRDFARLQFGVTTNWSSLGFSGQRGGQELNEVLRLETDPVFPKEQPHFNCLHLTSLSVCWSYFNKLIFDIWRSDLHFGGCNTGALSQRLIPAAEVPLSHRQLDYVDVKPHVSEMSTFQERNVPVFTFYLQAVQSLSAGFRKISSDWKLKDLLRSERIKKSFSSTRKPGRTSATRISEFQRIQTDT